MYELDEKLLKKIENLALEFLPLRRFLHSLSCGETLYKLCPKLGVNNSIALGLLHDIAHEKNEEYLRSYIKAFDIPLEDGEEEHHILLHAPVGAHLFSTIVKDAPKEFITAIRRHTIPSVDMDEIAYSLFIADIIEPTRPFISEEEREKVYSIKSYEEKMLYILNKQDENLRNSNFKRLVCTNKLISKLKQQVISNKN